MKNRNNYLKFITLLALVAFAAAWTTSKAAPRQTQLVERTLNFASIGITKGQTARVTGLAVGPCNLPVDFIFLDSRGKVLKQSRAIVESERFEFVDLNGDFLDQAKTRIQIRVIAKYQIEADHIHHDHLIGTLEVVDNKTGKTTVGWSVPDAPE